MTDSERATLRVALSRFKLEIERPGLLGAGANADALRLQHLRNIGAMSARLLQVEATDERPQRGGKLVRVPPPPEIASIFRHGDSYYTNVVDDDKT